LIIDWLHEERRGGEERKNIGDRETPSVEGGNSGRRPGDVGALNHELVLHKTENPKKLKKKEANETG